MRVPARSGTGGLSVTTSISDRVGAVSLRGAAHPDSLGPLLHAIDGLFVDDVRGIVLDCTGVTSWSVRGLEIAVLTATRAHGQRMGFAACGLPPDQLAVLRRRWPGVRPDQFAHTDRETAFEALHAVTS